MTIGCNLAVDTGDYTFHFAVTDTDIAARFTFVYEWYGSQWLIVSHHSSLAPADLY